VKSIAWTVGGYCAKSLVKVSWISRIPPNILTLVFGGSIAGAGVLIGFHGFNNLWPLPLIVGGVFLDCLDGPVARVNYRRSALGGYLDHMMHLLGDTALLVGAISYLSSSSGHGQQVWIAGVSILMVHFGNWWNDDNLQIEHELLDSRFEPRWSKKLSEGFSLFEPSIAMSALLGFIIGPTGFLLLCAAVVGSRFVLFFSMLFVVEHRTVKQKQQDLVTRVPARLASQRDREKPTARRQTRSRKKKRPR
jgi:hypothetical protein